MLKDGRAKQEKANPGLPNPSPLLHEKNQSLVSSMQLYKILLPPAFVELKEERRLLLPEQSR